MDLEVSCVLCESAEELGNLWESGYFRIPWAVHAIILAIYWFQKCTQNEVLYFCLYVIPNALIVGRMECVVVRRNPRLKGLFNPILPVHFSLSLNKNISYHPWGSVLSTCRKKKFWLMTIPDPVPLNHLGICVGFTQLLSVAGSEMCCY